MRRREWWMCPTIRLMTATSPYHDGAVARLLVSAPPTEALPERPIAIAHWPKRSPKRDEGSVKPPTGAMK